MEVQTDPVITVAAPMCDQSIQAPQDLEAILEETLRAVTLDHSYVHHQPAADLPADGAVPPEITSATEGSVDALSLVSGDPHESDTTQPSAEPVIDWMQAYTSTPVKSTAHRGLQAARMEQSNSQSEDMDHSGDFSYQDDQLDITYLPHDDSSHSADESSGDGNEDNPVIDKKYVVFLDNLLKLVYLLRCSECGIPSPVDSVDQHEVGSGLTLTAFCISGHTIVKWHSQPQQGRMPFGNLLISSAILCSGETYQRVAHMCELINIRIPGKSTYNNYQRDYLIPEINHAWECEHRAVVREVQERGGDVSVAGDGRCDSPGFCAKYCLYTHMDLTSNKIMSLQLVQVTETGSSARMEVLGYQRGMELHLARGVQVTISATDRHVGVRKLHKDIYAQQGIKHEFDVYHLAAHVRRKLKELAKKPKLRRIQPWIRSLVNHLWWSAATCDGNPDLLVKKWVSITNHMCDVHVHPDNTMYRACPHGPLEDTEQRRTKWLARDSREMEALEKVVFHKNFLRDIRQLANFCHTGNYLSNIQLIGTKEIHCQTSNIRCTLLVN